ncbi:hypothetical protein ES703_08923 [subsurface metagenome]
MENIAAIIGAVSGIASLIAIVYLVGFWKGKVDTQLGSISQSMQKYPLEETALMTKTLWDIYVVDALRNRPDLAEHHSAYKLKKEGHDLIPDDIKKDLDRLDLNPLNNEAIACGWLVVKLLGTERISRMAEGNGLSLQESIAILSTYLEEKNTSA